MKKTGLYFLSIMLITSMFACNSEPKSNNISVEVPLTEDGKVDETKLPKFEFASESYDFGKIKQGEKVKFSFKFKNTGSTPLIISSASASCGCTVPSYPEDPIAPGAEALIDVEFDSNGKMGMQTKTVTLVANTIPNTKVLYLRGEILP
ncbi:MAG: DUF1573 domain-containing protein [bacterium]|jgi:hypothetical protein